MFLKLLSWKMHTKSTKIILSVVHPGQEKRYSLALLFIYLFFIVFYFAIFLLECWSRLHSTESQIENMRPCPDSIHITTDGFSTVFLIGASFFFSIVSFLGSGRLRKGAFLWLFLTFCLRNHAFRHSGNNLSFF